MITVATPGLHSLRQSNLFLRALWAEMRSVFGRCGWNYQPWRDGPNRRIHLGFADVGLAQPLQVALQYGQRDSVVAIEFEGAGEAAERLSEIVTKALGYPQLERIHEGTLRAQVIGGSVGAVESKSFALTPTDDGYALTLRVPAFDEIDARDQATHAAVRVLDVLAAATGVLFRLGNDTPRAGGRWALTDSVDSAVVAWIERVLFEDTDVAALRLLRACHHFHAARYQDALVSDGMLVRDVRQTVAGAEVLFGWNPQLPEADLLLARPTEIATTLYMSALEVASLTGDAPETCPACKQPKYGIARRVREFARRYADPESAESLVAFVNDYYGKRSKYLHEGISLSTPWHSSPTIPQLDPHTASGVTQPVRVSLTELRAWTSQLIRRHLQTA